MNRQKLLILGGAAAVLLAAGVFFSAHRASQQSQLGGQPVISGLKDSLGEVTEIRLSKGDGSLTTLRRADTGWRVAERDFPADNARVRELALGLSNLRVIEAKTSDKANYSRLGVESPDTPTATSTLVEVKAGEKSWSLIVGKPAGNRAVYVRKPDAAESLLAEPLLTADPEQKRWTDRLLTDIPGANIREVSVKTGKAPAYQVSRTTQGNSELSLSPLPKGRAAVSNMVLNGQVEALTSFHFDDVRALPSPTPDYPDSAIYRSYDGQVIEFAGRREGDKAFITVKAHRDAAPAAAPAAIAAPAPAAAASPDAAGNPAPAETPDRTTERLASRVQAVEFEIPGYKYDGMFKPLEDLLEKK